MKAAWTLVALSLLLATPSQAGNQLSCPSIPSLLKRYVDLHVGQGALDAALKDRAVERYLRYVDPSKSLFLKAEVASVRADLRAFLDEVDKGVCDRLDASHTRVLRKHAEMQTFVASMMANPKLGIDKTVALKVDPDDRAHPATASSLFTGPAGWQPGGGAASPIPLDCRRGRALVAQRIEQPPPKR